MSSPVAPRLVSDPLTPTPALSRSALDGELDSAAAAAQEQPADRAAWSAFGLGALVQLAAWIAYAEARVVPHYPGGHDQAATLARAYSSYQRLLDFGLLPGFLANLRLPSANGSLLADAAALWFLFVGPSRLGALSLNFLAFLGLQAAVFATTLRATRRRSLAAAAVGLLVAAETAYLTYGGLFDFRADLI